HHNIRENIKRFGAYNMHLICGEAPERLAELPDPDRVFIGGSKGNLEEIIFHAAGRLKPDGRIVVNAILTATAEKAPILLLQHGLHVDIRTIEVSRRRYPDGEKEKFNPITIVTGTK
ncbi:MAG: bifunctional cobalt-precorrin-7 (C(5))-methyltransferase/cobalt-precorrin-6B (C(15))-methyltransferase, partial [Desulfobulbaceae bacterium]|nr:bifunctional cobalt-precorrin-7 (C(5))-methyltransferase/cobalt-precorrin-6B (C(15))-methyltransferase [Desulfobulbaceae bacterium]